LNGRGRNRNCWASYRFPKGHCDGKPIPLSRQEEGGVRPSSPGERLPDKTEVARGKRIGSAPGKSKGGKPRYQKKVRGPWGGPRARSAATRRGSATRKECPRTRAGTPALERPEGKDACPHRSLPRGTATPRGRDIRPIRLHLFQITMLMLRRRLKVAISRIRSWGAGNRGTSS